MTQTTESPEFPGRFNKQFGRIGTYVGKTRKAPPKLPTVTTGALDPGSIAGERSFGVRFCYDPNEARGRSGFHSRPFALPAAQNTGSVLLGMVL